VIRVGMSYCAEWVFKISSPRYGANENYDEAERTHKESGIAF